MKGFFTIGIVGYGRMLLHTPMKMRRVSLRFQIRCRIKAGLGGREASLLALSPNRTILTSTQPNNKKAPRGLSGPRRRPGRAKRPGESMIAYRPPAGKWGGWFLLCVVGEAPWWDRGFRCAGQECEAPGEMGRASISNRGRGGVR
jgi:hypothetical protein